MSTEIYTTLPHATSSSALAHSMDSSQKHGFTNADEWTGHGSVGKTFKRVILILGLSGTGKTSFIRSVTEDETVMVNDSMVGRIEKVRGYPATIDGKTFTLVEPPAFDIDFTSAGDWEQVVKDLCMWLQDVNKQLSSPIEITGILYFHRISDDRIAGSSKRALRLLQALCGKNYMRNVRLVTTHWDMVTQDVGEAREQELKSEYWREMLDDGAETVPFQGEKDQGLNILSQLVQKHGDAKLQIQRELLEEGKQWEETQAAAALNSHLESALKKKRALEENLQSLRETISKLPPGEQQKLQPSIDDLENGTLKHVPQPSACVTRPSKKLNEVNSGEHLDNLKGTQRQKPQIWRKLGAIIKDIVKKLVPFPKIVRRSSGLQNANVPINSGTNNIHPVVSKGIPS